MACYIFGAGDFDGLEERPGAEDYVIAADGGYTACRRAGVEPQLLLGDFDRWRMGTGAAHVERVPVEKDDTDMMLAVKRGWSEARHLFHLYGGNGRPADGSHRGQPSGAFVSGGSRGRRLAPRTGRAMDRHPGRQHRVSGPAGGHFVGFLRGAGR